MKFLTNHKFQRFLSTAKSQQLISRYDVTIIGGGIIGTSTARELLNVHPKLRVALLEKEKGLGFHQTGHNSGVIHAGIYYKPGSLKAKLCVEGLHLITELCDKDKIPYKKVGKLIVATDEEETKQLKLLYERGLANNVPGLELIETPEGICKFEPECRGLKAIWSPSTAIIDYRKLTDKFADDFRAKNGDIRCSSEVKKIEESDSAEYPVRIVDKHNHVIESKYAVTCAGLYSDKVSMMTGGSRDPRIIPIRGEYLVLKPEKTKMVKSNIYPVPNPKLPFLGVHFTPRMDGNVWLGPNAVLAFRREGYSYFDINLLELFDALTYPGFRKLCAKHFRYGVGESVRSIVWPLQVKKLRKFLPNIAVRDCQRGPAGVRAQALDPQGNLIEDFQFDKTATGKMKDRILHCRNCPSPGATSSMAIAKMLVEKITNEFSLSALSDECKEPE